MRPTTVDAAPDAAAASAAFAAVPPARTVTPAWTRSPLAGSAAQRTSSITSPTATKRGSGDRAATDHLEDLAHLGRREQRRRPLRRERGRELLDEIRGLAVRLGGDAVRALRVRHLAERRARMPAGGRADERVGDVDRRAKRRQRVRAPPEPVEREAEQRQRARLVLPPPRPACDLERAFRPLGRDVRRLGVEGDLRARGGEPSRDQPPRPCGRLLGALPEARPQRLRAADVAGEQQREQQVRACELSRHAEREARRQLDGLLGAPPRLREIVDLAERERRVVQQRDRPPADVPRDLEHLVPDRDRLLVPPERGERQRLLAAGAQQRVGAAHVAGERARTVREVERALVLAHPVRRVGVQVQVLRQVVLPRLRHPQAERLLAELERALEVALRAAHRERLALHREHGRGRRLVAELVAQRRRLRRRPQRVLVALGPEVGVADADQGVQPLPSLELRQQRLELGRRTLVLSLQLDERERALQPQAPPLGVARRQLDGGGEELDHRLVRPRAAGRVGGREEVRDRAGGLAGLPPVVGEDRGQRLGGAERLLDVSGDRGVPLPPDGAGHGCVCDVADEDVPERELRVAGELARGIAADEVARLQLRQRAVDVADLAGRLQHVAPERAADDRCAEERFARLGRQRVDARRDRLADRDRQPAARLDLGQGGRELLEEQRVAAGGLDDRRQLGGRRALRAYETARQLGGLLGAQRVERDRRLRREAGAPGRAGVEQ